MMLHSLTKSAIFYCVGHVAQIKGTQRMDDIRGLTASHPLLGWALVIGVVAIAGLPPLGIFMTEFLIVTSTFPRAPGLTIALVIGILVALGALLKHLQSVAFGAPSAGTAKARASMFPIWAHLALVLAAGVYLPQPLVRWLSTIAALLG
jgi:hydrogenase-4 component F